MGLSCTSAPAAEPVTLTEAKAHLRVDGTSEDTYITALILAAREWCEAYSKRAFITSTWKLTLPSLANTRKYQDGIFLPFPPLQSITSITYLDNDGTRQTLSDSPVGTNYVIHKDETPGRIRLAYTATWPVSRIEDGSVEITFKAGYGDSGVSVPAAAKHAILIMVAHWFENREPVIAGISIADVPISAKALLNTIKIPEAS